jgi:hypothetical protein
LDPDFIIDAADPLPEDQPAKRSEIEALWRGVPEVRAVRTGRVRAVSSESFGVPGPRVAEVVEGLFKIIHPQGGY